MSPFTIRCLAMFRIARERLQTTRRGAVIVLAAVTALAAAGCTQLNLGDPFTQADRLMKRGDYAGARTIYNQLIDQKQNLKIAYANRCYANDALNKHEEAVHDCTESLAIDPAQTEVLNNRGVAYLKMGKRDEADADFTKAIELNPDYAEAYANRGKLAVDREDFEGAIADLDKAIELATTAKLDAVLSDAYGNRAMSYRSLGDTDLAFADYTRAIKSGNDPQAYWERGMFLYSMGYFDKASEDMKAVEQYAGPDSELKMMAMNQGKFLESRPKGFDPVSQATVLPGTPFPVPGPILTVEAGGDFAPPKSTPVGSSAAGETAVPAGAAAATEAMTATSAMTATEAMTGTAPGTAGAGAP